MYGKFLLATLLSITMASFFLVPGLANNFSRSQAGANSGGKPASSEKFAVSQESTPDQDLLPVKATPAGEPQAMVTPVEVSQPSPTPAAPDQSQKPVKLAMDQDYHSQRWETSLKNACGPTSLLMVLDYFGKAQSLPDVIRSFTISPDQGGFDPTCKENPVCLSAGVLEEVANGTYNMAVEAHQDWTFEQVYQALENDRPVIADVTFQLEVGGTGHFVVIYGVDPETKSVFYHDPYEGADQSASWDQFSASWNGPVDAGDPLQPAGYHGWGMALTPN